MYSLGDVWRSENMYRVEMHVHSTILYGQIKEKKNDNFNSLGAREVEKMPTKGSKKILKQISKSDTYIYLHFSTFKDFSKI